MAAAVNRLAAIALVAAACSPSADRGTTYDPLAYAAARAGRVDNLEAGVPPACYTKTDGTSNPCWVCHTAPIGPNHRTDWELQLEYAFSDVALHNHWTNLLADRRDAIAAIDDDSMLAYVREDNYQPLRDALAERDDFPGYVPDLDLSAGFDELGFARDGSGWRAVRFQPFPGSFWPTNGSADDVFIRLPNPFRTSSEGVVDLAVYRMNLALLEAAIAGDPLVGGRVVERGVEPVDERLIDFDLDGDGAVTDGVTVVRRLPDYYAGGAHDVPVDRYLFPRGTELLHSVRYLDPDAPALAAARMKELRYMRKVEYYVEWSIARAYEREADEKDEGRLPVYRGTARTGLLNAFGWQLQGWIEDAEGRLRLQTDEEHRYCMGCHSGLGVTVDQTFSIARKVPGLDGWRTQDLRGLVDRPQVGHPEPEAVTYMQRVGGGDEFRANDEMLAKLGTRAALLTDLIVPSRARALALNKAYWLIVREQSFVLGRDAVVAPAVNVHARIEGNGETALGASGRVFRDGRLHLKW